MKQVVVKRLPNDPLCLRVSIGGGETINGYYCTYRGTRKEAIKAIETVLIVLQNMPELEIEDDYPTIGPS